MKPVDFYAPPAAWTLPKWMRIALGATFGTMTVAAITLLTVTLRPSIVASAPLAATAAPVAAPAVVVPSPSAPSTPVAAVAEVHALKASHGKHHSVTRVAKVSAHTAVSAPSVGNKKSAAAILAHRDTAANRSARAKIDQMLGF